MKIVSILFFALLISVGILAEDSVKVDFLPALSLSSFTVPDGWEQVRHVTPKNNVKMLVRQPKANILPPSINLVVEDVEVSLSEYLQIVKDLHKYINNAELHDLGKINTKAGSAQLITIEMNSTWGDTKILQALFIKDNVAYVITATALKEDFPNYYKDFFNAIKSFDIHENIFYMVSEDHKRLDVMEKYCNVKEKWVESYHKIKKQNQLLSAKDIANKAFHDEGFQKQYWQPLTETIQISFTEMQKVWQDKVIDQLRQECLEYRG